MACGDKPEIEVLVLRNVYYSPEIYRRFPISPATVVLVLHTIGADDCSRYSFSDLTSINPGTVKLVFIFWTVRPGMLWRSDYDDELIPTPSTSVALVLLEAVCYAPHIREVLIIGAGNIRNGPTTEFRTEAEVQENNRQEINAAITNRFAHTDDAEDRTLRAQGKAKFMLMREYFEQEDWSGVFDEEEAGPWLKEVE